ncbi:MAG TPA: YARHG domain-containing protein [Spirochaetes bacterium]|nr:YARHG domain-containing protein [Spirochaetota bacterium]
MSKRGSIIIVIAIVFSIQSQSLVSNDKLPYNIYTHQQIEKTYNLRTLLIHRAEVYAARGYINKNKFLQNYMLRRSWYKPSKSFSPKVFTAKEMDYFNRLTVQIEKLKKKEKEVLIRKLKIRLRGRMSIKFTRLSDLDSDGYYDLIAICGKKFNISPRKLDNEASYHYYTRPNNLVLVAMGRTFMSKFPLSNEKFGRAEYVNTFVAGYYIGNGRPQIKVRIHSLPLLAQTGSVHKEQLYFFSLDNNRLKSIFSYEVYHSSSFGNQEKIMEHDVQFKNIKGDSMNELVLIKKSVTRQYKSNPTVFKSHSDQVSKGQKIYFQYDANARVYKQFYKK